MGPALASVEEHIGKLAHITEAAKARPGFFRFALLQLKTGQQEGLLQRVEREVVPLLRQQPGFIRLLVWRTGPDRAIVVTHYASRAEGEAATRGWVERHVAPAVASVQWHEGEVIWRVRDDPPA
ncbi:MAG: antibiotic biosynthesis monooxygenase [Actinobacteria bacterium]|nr:antibiotic biosynthesis monooxygenase [Actinomycetota bacterium]